MEKLIKQPINLFPYYLNTNKNLPYTHSRGREVIKIAEDF